MRGDGLLHPPLVRIGGIGVDSRNEFSRWTSGYGYLKGEFFEALPWKSIIKPAFGEYLLIFLLTTFSKSKIIDWWYTTTTDVDWKSPLPHRITGYINSSKFIQMTMWFGHARSCLGLSPCPTVTTRNIFFVGDPNLNLHLPLASWEGTIQVIP